VEHVREIIVRDKRT